jgi:TM2 domain-containing membrane protein YozV
MTASHKNKTIATLLALILGAIGAHRFYLRSGADRLGVLHLTSVPLCGMIYGLAPQAHWFFQALPLIVSAIVGFVEALVIGLTADEQFDARFNAGSGRKSESNWMLAVLLVITMLIGTVTMIATLARLFDLLYTGGAYG